MFLHKCITLHHRLLRYRLLLYRHYSLFIFLILFSAFFLFIVGVFLPSYRIIVHFGSPTRDAFIQGFFPWMLEDRNLSILTTIITLFKEGEYKIGIIILFFSIVFPSVKLLALLLLSIKVNITISMKSTIRKFLHYFGSLSMVDVFVVSMVVLLSKELPGGTKIQFLSGMYCFMFSVLLTLFAAAMEYQRDKHLLSDFVFQCLLYNPKLEGDAK